MNPPYKTAWHYPQLKIIEINKWRETMDITPIEIDLAEAVNRIQGVDRTSKVSV